MMMRSIALALGAMMLVGCGSNGTPFAVGQSVNTSMTPRTAAGSLAAEAPGPHLVGNASPNLAPDARNVLPNAPAFDIEPFRQAAGTVGKFERLSEKDVGYGSQLLPIDTQLKADNIARGWAGDAKQVYIGWGFWNTTLLAQTQHFYYSPSKKKKLVITFKLISWRHTTEEEDAPKFDLANKILKGAADVHSWNGSRAHGMARRAGYTPAGRNQVGVLIHPIILGPHWVWLDNEEHQYPLMAVDAHSGEVIRDGLKMMALRYMFANQ